MASKKAPKSSRPWRAKSRPEANFPNLIEKPYESHETSLKKSKKHCARAQSGSQVPRIAVKSSFLEFVLRSAGSCGIGPRTAARTLPSTRAGGQDDGSLNKLPQIKMLPIGCRGDSCLFVPRVVERGTLGLDPISAQAWRGTQTNSQSSSGGVSRGTEHQKNT